MLVPGLHTEMSKDSIYLFFLQHITVKNLFQAHVARMAATNYRPPAFQQASKAQLPKAKTHPPNWPVGFHRIGVTRSLDEVAGCLGGSSLVGTGFRGPPGTSPPVDGAYLPTGYLASFDVEASSVFCFALSVREYVGVLDRES